LVGKNERGYTIEKVLENHFISRYLQRRNKLQFRNGGQDRTDIAEDIQVELRPEFTQYYEGAPNHPWKDKDANYIMRWLNYWSTSEFMFVKSTNIVEDMFLLSRGDAEIRAFI
jgi:hypothetical protein